MDLRYALRTLRKSPGFTATAILTLALGIGASSAIFTLLDQVSLRLLPVNSPERLVLLRWEGNWNGSNTGYAAWSYPWYEDLRDQSGEIFEDLFGRFGMKMALGYSGETENADIALVTGNYFHALGVGAARGRVLGPADNEQIDGHPVAILSYEYWRDQFGSAPDVIGRTILITKQPFEIVGVAQRGFHGLELNFTPRVFIPAVMKNTVSSGFHRTIYPIENRRGRWLNVFGRLRDGIGREQAQAALEPIFHAGLQYDILQPELSGMDEYGRERYLEAIAEVLPGGQGRRNVREGLDGPLAMLMAMVALLLLIACGNVANLLMARAAGRSKEIAVRFAVGAGRGRIVGQLMLESALLATSAAALGLLIAGWAASFIVRFAPGGPASFNLSTDADWRVVAFAASAAALTAFVFGLTPALRSTRLDLASTLKDQAGSIAGGSDSWRRALAGAQIFLSLLLLIGAGLFQRSLAHLRSLDTGVEAEHAMVFAIDPLQGGYSPERSRVFLAELKRELEARPEIRSAGFSTMRILSGDDRTNTVQVEGYERARDESTNPHFNAVSPGYFETLEVPMLEGRAFNEADLDGAPRVGIVNAAFVQRYFKGESPIGRRFGFGEPDIEIVGVIPDVRYSDLRQEIPEQVFVPFAQSPWPTGAHVYVRTDRDPEDAVPAVRAVARQADASLPLADLRMMEAQLEMTLTAERLLAFLASAFGVLATLLAAVGLYGLLAYSVSRRGREIGLRMALGAQRSDIAWMVLREVFWLFAIGATTALPVSLALGRWTESQLYGVKPADPLSMMIGVAILAAAALAAGYFPARRAARIEPMHALRSE